MVFNSLQFLIFYPIIVLLNFVLPMKFRWIMLLAASYYFYMSWNPSLIFLIMFTTAVSYFSAIRIEKTENKLHRKIYLVLTLIVCLGILFFFKYFDFMARSVIGLIEIFGGSSIVFSLNLILPVGISFYTFQTLSYVIDVYRGTVKVEPHFGYYALYVSFFPQLVAGPIERPENLIPQLHTENHFDWNNTISGLRIMIIGFFKKVVVADLIAVYVNNIYNSPQNAAGFSVVIATVLFAFQIYCDFSGYTDIAIGCAKVMGISLMQNFDRPYRSESIKEFWGRWHISLSSWFRDYLYIPLGGNRCGKFRHLFNIVVVFLVSGLWHGAAWTFVIWGALHGFYQVVGYLTLSTRRKLIEKIGLTQDSAIVHIWRKVFTFILVCFAWIFFRANSMSDLGILLKSLFTNWQFSTKYFAGAFDALGIDLIAVIITILSLFILIRLDNGAFEKSKTYEISNNKYTLSSLMPSFKYSFFVWVIAVAWLIMLRSDGAGTFIYFQF